MTLDRYVRLAVLAANDAVAHAGLDHSALSRIRGGVIVGNACGPTVSLHQNFAKLFNGEELPQVALLRCLNGAAASQISIRWGLNAMSLSISAECASASTAIHYAAKAISRGELDIVLAGGAEAPLGEGCYLGWEALGMGAMARPDVHDTPSSCRPFAKTRTGFVLGEGAALFVMESEASARARRAPILGRLLGSALSSDAYHPVAPHVDGQVRAMQAAIEGAGLKTTDIAYVNAHGTATQVGDLTETRSLRTVFGSHAEQIGISSTKSTHGHMIGASGAIELAVTLTALQNGFMPPTAHLDEPDPGCDLDYVPRQARAAPDLRYALSNSFGFGGSNACLVVGRA